MNIIWWNATLVLHHNQAVISTDPIGRFLLKAHSNLSPNHSTPISSIPIQLPHISRKPKRSEEDEDVKVVNAHE